MKTCKVCSKDFIAKHGGTQICSDECRGESKKIAYKKWSVKRSSRSDKEYTGICNISICDNELSGRNRVFCAECKRSGNVAREFNLLNKYNMTIITFNEIFEGQGRVCAICAEDDPRGKGYWHVDHDHKTGRVRGILCDWCNRGLGQYRDNVDYLFSAAAYLLQASGQVECLEVEGVKINGR